MRNLKNTIINKSNSYQNISNNTKITTEKKNLP
jgi:hypothetical protein